MSLGYASPVTSQSTILRRGGRNGRGREAGYPAPPAQIPACATNAPGSCRRSDVIGLRGQVARTFPIRGHAAAMTCQFRLCVRDMRSERTLPSTDRLPSTVSATNATRLCSRLPRYYAVVRLLMPSGRASLNRASPTGPEPLRGCGRHEASQVPHKGRLHVHGVYDCARSVPCSPFFAWNGVAFSQEEEDRHLGKTPVSQLNTQPMVSPVNASRQPSRTAAHHSGPERLARPYSAVDSHLLSFASLSWRTPDLGEHTTSRGESGPASKAGQELGVNSPSGGHGVQAH